MGQFVTGQSVIGQFNKPITFKVVVTCVRARLLLCFSRLIAGRRRGGLRMFMSPF